MLQKTACSKLMNIFKLKKEKNVTPKEQPLDKVETAGRSGKKKWK